MAEPIQILNETIQYAVQGLPVFSIIQSTLDVLKVLVGGLFGFYVIKFVYDFFVRRKEIMLLEELNRKIDTLTHRIDAMERKRKRK